MAVHIWRSLLVDRIGIAVSIVASDLHKYACSQMYTLQAQQSSLLPGGKIWVNKGKFWTRFNYYPDCKTTPKRKIADVTIGKAALFGSGALHRYLTLGLYPSKFKAGEFDHLKKVLAVTLPEFAYDKLYNSGRVNYLELAVDSLSHEHHSFLPIRKYCSDSMIFEEDNGHLGTAYLGSVHSNLRFRIYDKRKQLVDTGHQPMHHTHTRIEAVVRRMNLEPAKLAQMENPFERIEVADLQRARDLSKEKAWQGFLDLCLKRATPAALSEHPKHRKLFMKMLKASAAGWWKPKDVWAGIPQALKAIAP